MFEKIRIKYLNWRLKQEEQNFLRFWNNYYIKQILKEYVENYKELTQEQDEDDPAD